MTANHPHRTASRFMVACVSALLVSSVAWAQSSDHSHHAPATTAQASTTWAEGQVLKIDPDSRKVTLKHGEITALEMPAMTMVFQVDDTALLKGLTTGHDIHFQASHHQGRYVLTAWKEKNNIKND